MPKNIPIVNNQIIGKLIKDITNQTVIKQTFNSQKTSNKTNLQQQWTWSHFQTNEKIKEYKFRGNLGENYKQFKYPP